MLYKPSESQDGFSSADLQLNFLGVSLAWVMKNAFIDLYFHSTDPYKFAIVCA